MKDTVLVRGYTERRLFDAFGNPKKMFSTNSFWHLLKNTFGVDLKIPFLTGYWTVSPVADNLVVTRGKQLIAGQMNGVSSTAATAMAIGTGSTAANAADTALQTEITTNGGARAAGTTSLVTTTTTSDTAQWVHTWTFTGSFAVTEEGLLDNNVSGGNLLARQVFSAVNVISGDTLAVTHKIQLT